MRASLLFLLSAFFLSCAPILQDPPWNIKEINTDKYQERIHRSAAYLSIVNTLNQHHADIAILTQISNDPSGSLAGIYADGRYYDFSDPDSSRKLGERSLELIKASLGPHISISRLLLDYCIDLSHSTTRVDAGTIKADLTYQLLETNTPHAAMEENLRSDCLPASGGKILYRNSIRIDASLDGTHLKYQVVNPAKPLLEVERFDIVLSDLTYQAAEAILADRELAGAIDNRLQSQSQSLSGTLSNKAVCDQLRLKEGSRAFEECLKRFSAPKYPGTS